MVEENKRAGEFIGELKHYPSKKGNEVETGLGLLLRDWRERVKFGKSLLVFFFFQFF